MAGDGQEPGGATPEAVHGHRERLRRRVLDPSDGALATHEILEYLLATAIPRRDTKPLARELLKEFGSLSALLAADPGTVMRHPGMGPGAAAAIRIVQRALVAALREQVADRPVLGSWDALLDYLRARMAHRPVESVRVLFLNSRNVLIADEALSEGAVDQASIHVREVLRRALELQAVAIILVHNHPSGDPHPSRQDIALTKDIVIAGRVLGVAVHDHIIVGARGHASFRTLGLL